MEISTQFSTYFWLSCLTILVTVAIQFKDATDNDIYNFFINSIFPNLVKNDNPVEEGVFSQRIDHYNRFEYAKRFDQRYFVNKKYYNSAESEPVVLLVVSAMTNITAEILQDEFYMDFAKNTNALMLALEPRFYGESQPFGDLKTSNLYYLHTEQSLADLARFTELIPKKLEEDHSIVIPKNAKWMSIGRDYGGSLAAWFRLKYPHYVDLAVPIGAPMWEILSYEENFVRVEKAFNSRPTLKNLVKAAYQEIIKIIEDNTDQNRNMKLEKLKNDLKMCHSITDSDGVIIQNNVQLMFYSITYYLGFMSQAPDEKFKEIKKQAWSTLFGENREEDKLERLTKTIKFLLEQLNHSCLESDYRKNVEIYKNESVDAVERLPEILRFGIGSRAVLYQRCFEFGQFEVPTSETMFYGYVPLSFYLGLCENVFNAHMNERNLSASISATNRFYGSHKYEGRKSIFINNIRDHYTSRAIKTPDQNTERIVIRVDDIEPFIKLSKIDKDRLRKKYNKIFAPLTRWLGKSTETENNEYKEDPIIPPRDLSKPRDYHRQQQLSSQPEDTFH